MLRFIAIVAGLVFAAKALKSRASVADDSSVTRSYAKPSEEELEQEIRATV